MTEKKRSWLPFAIPVILLVAVLIGILAFQLRSGIRVTIENTGTTTLESVVLHVTGASYNMGDIVPGASATARVSPTSESHLEIEFTDADGQAQRLDAGGYLEPGYRGTIRVSIKDGVIDKNGRDIKLR